MEVHVTNVTMDQGGLGAPALAHLTKAAVEEAMARPQDLATQRSVAVTRPSGRRTSWGAPGDHGGRLGPEQRLSGPRLCLVHHACWSNLDSGEQI